MPLSEIPILTTRPACEWPTFFASVFDLYFDHEASMRVAAILCLYLWSLFWARVQLQHVSGRHSVSCLRSLFWARGQHVSGRHFVPFSVISFLSTRPAGEWPPFCAFFCDLYLDHDTSMWVAAILCLFMWSLSWARGQQGSGRHSVPLSVISILNKRPVCEWPPFWVLSAISILNTRPTCEWPPFCAGRRHPSYSWPAGRQRLGKRVS